MLHSGKNAVIKALEKKYTNHTQLNLALSFLQSLPESYLNDNAALQVAADIHQLIHLTQDHPIQFDLIDDQENMASRYHLRIYQQNQLIALSDILPILENLGLRTLSEETFVVKKEDKIYYIIDFSVVIEKIQKNNDQIKSIFIEALRKILDTKAENDAFNKLIIAGGISIEQIVVLRAYCKYLGQCKYRYSQAFIEKTMIDNITISKQLLNLFYALHDPSQSNKTSLNNELSIEKEIEKQLSNVASIGEDNVIRRFMLLIKLTLRTNYFQLNANGNKKNYLSLKINSGSIPDLPLPKPVIDTFVYSSLFEGIHLRSSRVARGGIRWSDRHDDYRTEILGLMKAQRVKNAIIIPSGAKGGFILKDASFRANKDTKTAKIACYQDFIRGLLDVTDNIINNKVVHPKNMICRDENDTYFVVAADKGTADLSDYANEVSNEYQFWLGDAFASGGKNGYDHKKIGITAKGAWESLKRNLLELNLQDQDITMVGIGDMSGDVFGNGLILSDRIKLIAAFDHRHIFLDPNPNPTLSYEERNRLFKLPTSSWADYNNELLSTGGRIFNRSAKTISLTDEIKQALAIDEDELTPDQLICAILKAPVDVLYNGGIGTYVKASTETSENVGDKTNEFCRINGNDLRCRIVCEGGNLGFTQLARVEFAVKGGLINTDFIDNSGGVDCSDHEVNLKILLNTKVSDGKMTLETRNTILNALENEISALVLKDNYNQALLMSYSSMHAASYADLYIDHINTLESVYHLDRKVEHLPTSDELVNRKSQGHGLTRPELAVLLAYTKLYIKDELLKTSLPDNDFFNDILTTAFPTAIRKECQKEIEHHRLRREIIATQISNHLINTMGITFIFRLMNETGASIQEVVTSHTIAEMVYHGSDIREMIQSLDGKISIELQYELLHYLRSLINMATRWFIRNNFHTHNLTQNFDHYRNAIIELEKIIPSLVVGSTNKYIEHISSEFEKFGVETDLAKRVALLRVMYNALNITSVAAMHGFNLVKTAKLYFHVGAVFKLVYFRDLISADNRPGKRNNNARLALRDNLDALQRKIVISIYQSNDVENDVAALVKQWTIDNSATFTRWEAIIKNVMEIAADDYTLLFTSLHQLSDMISDTQKNERVSMLAYHDTLTKLPNRLYFHEKLDATLAKANRDNKSFALHLIDVDKFKEINDTYGHPIGDQVLIEMAKRLKSVAKEYDIVARLAGDEFVILQGKAYSEFDALHFAHDLLTAVKKPIILGDIVIHPSCSIGTTMSPLEHQNAGELIARADAAMYLSKQQGRGQVNLLHATSTMAPA